MLKPTVGIELEVRWSTKAISNKSLHCKALHILDGELSTLRTSYQHLKVGYNDSDGRLEERNKLTAKTRRRDVFPAFCSPIMVTSISVALEDHDT